MAYLWGMKIFFCILLTSICAFSWSQDKVYLLNGEVKKGVILEVSPNNITFMDDYGTTTLEKTGILLVEFKSGKTEVFNKATVDLFATNGKGSNPRFEKTRRKVDTVNMLSVNCAALCNADLAFFYERLLFNKRIGIGLMGAYNFNSVTNFYNLYLFPLEKSKKVYDVGFHVNYYTKSEFLSSKMIYGLLVKYTEFSYTAIFEERIGTGSASRLVTRRVNTASHHTATLFTVGTHTSLNHNLFIRTVCGMGGYLLHGIYKQQYNYKRGPDSNVGFLPKLYLGVNVGFNF
jgi:hypothetical protein